MPAGKSGDHPTKRRGKPAEVALREFWERRDSRSFRAVFHSYWYGNDFSRQLRTRLEEAVWYAVDSSDWWLRAAGIAELHDWGTRYPARRADAIMSALLAKQKLMRSEGWIAIDGLRVARLVLSRMEAVPPKKLLTFETLMAIDEMAHYLTAPRDRARLIALLRVLEKQPQRSYKVAWKIGESLYSDLHLDLEPDDESIDAEYWREQRRADAAEEDTDA